MSEPKQFTPSDALVKRMAWEICFACHNRHDGTAESEARKNADRFWPRYVPVAHTAIEASGLGECVEALEGLLGLSEADVGASFIERQRKAKAALAKVQGEGS